MYKQNFEVAMGGKFGPLLLLNDVVGNDGWIHRRNERSGVRNTWKLATSNKALVYKLSEKCEARRILKVQKNRSTEDAQKYREAKKKELK